MNNQLKLLKYLKKKNADVSEKSINEILPKLTIFQENVYDFLNDLEKNGYIKWTDARPLVPYSTGTVYGSRPDVNAPLNYTAKITIEGLKFLREDRFKVFGRTTAIVAAFIAFIAILVSTYFGISSKEKQKEIDELSKKSLFLESRNVSAADSITMLKSIIVELRKNIDNKSINIQKKPEQQNKSKLNKKKS